MVIIMAIVAVFVVPAVISAVAQRIACGGRNVVSVSNSIDRPAGSRTTTVCESGEFFQI
jgi:hypothetical protein